MVFAGANVVTSTLITGGTLGLMGAPLWMLAAVALAGILIGTAPIALLARLGPRTGLPTMVLLRQPFGIQGARLIALLLVVTNFAWIALNNVVAAQAIAAVSGGDERLWSVLVGAVATVLALGGERVMAMFDRVAVPLLALLGLWLTVKLVSLFGSSASVAGDVGAIAVSGFAPLLAIDLVIGYQVSWALMFADYTRFQAREAQASKSVLLGLSATSLWLMLVGVAAVRLGDTDAATSVTSVGNDPTAMILGLGLPVTALLLVALSTVTTNFVNLFLSGLAVRNLAPALKPAPVVIGVGIVGTGLGLVSGGFLESYAAFMGTLATLLLPIVAIALVHFFWSPRCDTAGGPQPQWRPAAVCAWLAGAIIYQLAAGSVAGATIPTLVGAGGVYVLLNSWGVARRSI